MPSDRDFDLQRPEHPDPNGSRSLTRVWPQDDAAFMRAWEDARYQLTGGVEVAAFVNANRAAWERYEELTAWDGSWDDEDEDRYAYEDFGPRGLRVTYGPKPPLGPVITPSAENAAPVDTGMQSALSDVFAAAKR